VSTIEKTAYFSFLFFVYPFFFHFAVHLISESNDFYENRQKESGEKEKTNRENCDIARYDEIILIAFSYLRHQYN
jgi:hypothetical protein